jgi:TPR repeat protein
VLLLVLFLAAAKPSHAADTDYAALCDKGQGEACNALALAYHDGRGVTQDLAKAAELYGKACTAGLGAGCQNLGDLHAQSNGDLARQQARVAWSKAANLYRRACDAGALELCVNLGTLHEDGKLAPEGAAPGSSLEQKELATAAALYDKACSGGDVGGCGNLASLYADGRGVAKDERKATALLTGACNGLKRAKGERNRHESAGACVNLALLVQQSDPKRAAALDDAACDAGVMLACSNLGMLVENANPAKGARLFRKACDGGEALACWNLALMTDAGVGVKKDPVTAKALRERACKMGVAKACQPGP